MQSMCLSLLPPGAKGTENLIYISVHSDGILCTHHANICSVPCYSDEKTNIKAVKRLKVEIASQILIWKHGIENCNSFLNTNMEAWTNKTDNRHKMHTVPLDRLQLSGGLKPQYSSHGKTHQTG